MFRLYKKAWLPRFNGQEENREQIEDDEIIAEIST